MAGSNDRNRNFSSAGKGNFKGRSDYDSGRPKKGFESPIDQGDKGIPSGISTSKEYVEKKGVQFSQEAGDKGIPPMHANPKGGPPKVTGGGIRD